MARRLRGSRAMADEKRDEAPKDAKKQDVTAPDQLSPGEAMRESLGASRSQRVGDSGPVANPIVSFPDDPDASA
jgi:hypothetical protein